MQVFILTYFPCFSLNGRTELGSIQNLEFQMIEYSDGTKPMAANCIYGENVDLNRLVSFIFDNPEMMQNSWRIYQSFGMLYAGFIMIKKYN